MKQTSCLRRFYLLTFMLIAMTMGAKAESVPYAELVVKTHTLYFRYGEMPSSNAWDASDTGGSPGWESYNVNVETVIIDESFAAARPKSCARWFKVQDGIGGMIRNVEGLQYLNTSEVTNMAYMFYNSYVANLELSNFDTSNVTDMSYMFEGCELLASLDVSRFNTSKVTDMSYMFYGCKSLESLDVSRFDTSNVTNMTWLFYNCNKLTSLDVSSFNTSKVTDMSRMFSNCDKLESLDVSSFNTSKVTNMGYMFSGCSGLTSLDVSGFNTSRVNDMHQMFYWCYNLTSLDVSSFNTSNVTDMSYMFCGCKNLTAIYSNETWTCSSSEYMFSGCNNLKGAVSWKSVSGDGDISWENKTNCTYANPETGYFTKKNSLDVCGVMVTPTNCDDLTVIDGVSGTVRYDYATNTLYLKNATITSSNYKTGIKAYYDENRPMLNINVEGECTVSTPNVQPAFTQRKQLNITGDGILNLSGSQGIYADLAETHRITVTDNVTVNIDATVYGIRGYVANGTYFTTLAVEDDAILNVKGTTQDIFNLGSLTYDSGVLITAPSGATFSGTAHTVTVSGVPVANETVTIMLPRYDLSICGVQVNDRNKGKLSVIDGVEGTASFDPITNTLTLNNATITTDTCAIYSKLGELTINVKGENNVKSNSDKAVCSTGSTLTFNGTGVLNLYGTSAIATVTQLRNVVNVLGDVDVNAEASGSSFLGLVRRAGSGFTASTSLNVETSGEFKVKGDVNCFYGLAALKMADGIDITLPEGAEFSSSEFTVLKDGSAVAGKWVRIGAETYDLWIQGRQMNAKSATAGITDYLGRGKATYDDATKTLTLTNAFFASTQYGSPFIESMIDDLTIKAVGNNSLLGYGKGIYQGGKNLTITGDTLSIFVNNEDLYKDFAIQVAPEAGSVLSISDCRLLGARGTSALRCLSLTPSLVVSGANTNVALEGSYYACAGFTDVTLNDGLAVISPTGVEYKQDSYYYADGEFVKKLTIGLLGDANSDGYITMADANLIVNYFLATDKKTVTGIDLNKANANGDTQEDGSPSITMADANQIVNMFLNNGK